LDSALRRIVHYAVPSDLQDPIGLAIRALRSGPEGRFAVFLAGLNLLATPIDKVVAVSESRTYRRACSPRLPIVFICGPSRSGTSVVALTIARALPVAYFTNLTSVFPRSPITFSRLFRLQPRSGRLSLRSHYGRTAGVRGWNDGLYLWDRWLGEDRTSVRSHISQDEGLAMARFFGAFEQWSGRPLVTKNNSLIVYAALVARYLPTAHFICLERDPLYLAQSLLVARSYIHGTEAISYGRDDPTRIRHSDPAADVCGQVRFYARLMREQQNALGPERFRVVSYEDFCANPAKLVTYVARNILDVPVDETQIPTSLAASHSQTVSDEVFRKLKHELGRETPA